MITGGLAIACASGLKLVRMVQRIGKKSSSATPQARAGKASRRCMVTRRAMSDVPPVAEQQGGQQRTPTPPHPLPSPPHEGEGVASGVWHHPATATGPHLPPCGGGWEGGEPRTRWSGYPITLLRSPALLNRHPRTPRSGDLGDPCDLSSRRQHPLGPGGLGTACLARG